MPFRIANQNYSKVAKAVDEHGTAAIMGITLGKQMPEVAGVDVYDAFDVGAFQYLVKPVDEQKFTEVLGRAAGQIVSEAEQRKKKLVLQYGGEIPMFNMGIITEHGIGLENVREVTERYFGGVNRKVKQTSR